MSDAGRKHEGVSMWLHRASGIKLITAPIAVEIARLVLKERYGQSELDRNEPFQVVEDGDAWIVQGRHSAEQSEKNPPNPAWAGPLRLRISQFDAQILDFFFLMDWAKAVQTAQPEMGP